MYAGQTRLHTSCILQHKKMLIYFRACKFGAIDGNRWY